MLDNVKNGWGCRMDESRVGVGIVKIQMWIIKMDNITNAIKGTMKIAPLTEKLRNYQLAW